MVNAETPVVETPASLERRSTPVQPLPLEALPAIDYAAHSAYARSVRAAPLVLRLRALSTFSRGFAVALLRWITDSEHLPRPPVGAGRFWVLAHAPMLVGRTLANTMRRVMKSARSSTTASRASRSVAEALRRDGCLGLTFSDDDIECLRIQSAPWFEQLEARMAGGIDGFDDNRLRVEAKDAAALYEAARAILDAAGILDGSALYIGRRMRLAHLVPQTNTPETDFWTARFADCGEPDPACNYCHIDTAWGVTKMLIYLDDVGPANGPFGYAIGTHRISRSIWERLVRKANDHAGLSSTAPERRRLFAALPRPLRKKGAFGADLRDTDAASAVILAAEHWYMSDGANAVLFDPDGIHRGGMVQSGRRRVLGVLLADL